MPQRFRWWRYKDIYFVSHIQRTTSGKLWKKWPFGQETEYGYNSASHKHSVTHLDEVQKYWYDDDGNMITRVVGGQTYNLWYDPENRLVGVSGAATATFTYDGDGKRVKATIGGTTTVYIANYYE